MKLYGFFYQVFLIKNPCPIEDLEQALRFGAELIFAICEEMEIEVVLINQGSENSFEEDLAADVLEIITVFSARLYGSGSKKNKKLIKNLEKAVTDGTAKNP